MAVALFLGTTIGILDVFSTRPVLLPPLPNGAILDIRESFDLPSAVTKTERGGAIWPAAELMCRWLGDEPDRILGARIMELGSGTGACGLYAAALGADSVLLTDGGGPELLDLIRLNIDANRPLIGDTDVGVEYLDWGDTEESCLAAEDGFDLILAADVLYGLGAEPAEDAVVRCDALAATLEALMLCSPDRPPRAIVVHEHRDVGLRASSLPWDAGDPNLEYFIEAVQRRGLSVAELATQPPTLLDEDEEGVREWSSDLVLFEVAA